MPIPNKSLHFHYSIC